MMLKRTLSDTISKQLDFSRQNDSINQAPGYVRGLVHIPFALRRQRQPVSDHTIKLD